MDLRQLRYFAAIAEYGSFSEAATRLHVAQSALSRHTLTLEQELGVKLFERHPRGVEHREILRGSEDLPSARIHGRFACP